MRRFIQAVAVGCAGVLVLRLCDFGQANWQQWISRHAAGGEWMLPNLAGFLAAEPPRVSAGAAAGGVVAVVSVCSLIVAGWLTGRVRQPADLGPIWPFLLGAIALGIVSGAMGSFVARYLRKSLDADA